MVGSWLEAEGNQASIYRGGVTDTDTVNNVVHEIGSNLACNFQAAMVLQDTHFAKMTIAQWEICANPKLLSTWNLHNAIIEAGYNPNFFVCFSSSSATLGALGQANSAAENGYIDVLMAHRRSAGLISSTMNVGMVGGIDVVAEDGVPGKTMKRLDYEPINEEELFYRIEEAVIILMPSHLRNQNDERVSGNFDEYRVITGVNRQRRDVYWCARPLLWNLYAHLDLDLDDNKSCAKCSRSLLKLTIVAVEFRNWFLKVFKVDMALFDMLGAQSIITLIDENKLSLVLSSNHERTDTTGSVTDIAGIQAGAEASFPTTFVPVADSLITQQKPIQYSLRDQKIMERALYRFFICSISGISIEVLVPDYKGS